MRRALIIGPGGLRGAYAGGVVTTLCRAFGKGYFSTVYGCSAGAHIGGYAVSGQSDCIEGIFRECVHADLLVRLSRIISLRESALDLSYLNEVLRSSRYRLDISGLLASSTRFEIVVTNRQTGLPCYLAPRSEAEFYLQVRASADVPALHSSVRIGDRTYIDGGSSDLLPVMMALASGHESVVVVSNRPLADLGKAARVFLQLYAIGARLPGVRSMWERLARAARLAQAHPDRIQVITPTKPLTHSWHDQKRLNTLVDMGIRDTQTYLATHY